MSVFTITLFCFFLCICSICVTCVLELPAFFSDDMVLQRDVLCPIWGRCEASARVRVQLMGEMHETRADRDGHWRISLPPRPAGGPCEIVIECGDARRVIRHVMVGEVWVCSGQSNMGWPVQSCVDAGVTIRDADRPGLHLLQIPQVVSDEPLWNAESQWARCTPSAVRDFSAVAYFFGRRLHSRLDVPIGLIDTSWGGTTAQAWTPPEVLRRRFPSIIEGWEDERAAYPDALKRYEERFSEWQRTRDRARESGDPVPPAPPAPRTPSDPHPGGLYNAMLAPLIPWSIRGAIWYQGESNAGQAELYRRLFPAMIDGWRDKWGRDFPFYFVQLPNYDPPDGSLPEHVWARMREAQSAALDLPRTGMAVTIDVGETHDLHPPDKLPVGERLARLALHDSYGEEISARSPMLDSVRLESEEVRVHFTNVDGGLVIHGDTAQGFELLSEGRDTIPVTARAEGESVMLGIRGDREPAEVRYAWANAPDANLYSTAGLPAAPFRTKL